MARELALPCAGIVTDPNKRATVKGALAQGNNAVVDSAGVLEPRPGLSRTVATVQPTRFPYSLVAYLGDLLTMTGQSGGTGYCIAERLGANIDGLDDPPRPTLRGYSTFEQRGNLYATGHYGPQKLSAVAASPGWLWGGIPQGLPPLATLDTSGLLHKWFTGAKAVAYAVCWRRTDSNGYVVRGAPSLATRVLNDGAAARVTLDIPLPLFLTNKIRAGDVLEIYRTVMVDPTTTEPPADMNLAIEHTLTTGEVGANLVTLSDTIAETVLVNGAALYTGPGEQGPDQENSEPPWCSDMAVYNHLAFYGDIQLPASFVLSLQGADGYAWDGGNQVGRTAGSTFTVAGAGLSQVTVAVAPPYVGECISDGASPIVAGAALQAETIVTAVTGAGPWTVTISKTTLAAAAGAACLFYDVVRVGGVNFFASNAFDYATRQFDTNGAAHTSLTKPLMQFCYCVNRTSATVTAQPLAFGLTESGVTSGMVQVLFTERYVGAAAADKTCTESSVGTLAVYAPMDARYPGTAPDRLQATIQPGGVYVSKPYEPEAVPLEQLLDVGDTQKRVLRMIATATAVWIFKEDGLFRVSGTSFATMQADLMDPTCTLLQPEAADVMDGVIYAWSDSGVIAVSDAGAKPVSVPMIGSSLVSAEQMLVTNDRVTGAFLVCDAQQKRVYIGVPSAADKPYSNSVFVLSGRTGAWTTWGVIAFAACFDPVISGLAASSFVDVGGVSTRDLLLQRERSNALLYGDRNVNCTVATSVLQTDGTYLVTLTGAPAAPYVTAIGDAVLGATANATVLSIVTTSSFYTDRDPGTGGGKLLQGYTVTVEWQPFALGDVSVGKVFQEVRLTFDESHDLSRLTMAYPPTSTSITATMARTASATDAVKRIGVPRAPAQAGELRPRLSITQALSYFRLDGICVVWEPGAEVRTR